ncbi:MAG: U32 family peptidase [Treponemataceae bacterium]|nr:U32 family peptidase [Treponemataceae bacterium]
MHLIELLSPAGSEDAFFAAVEAGADAVYFGTDRFNARERAQNIPLERIPALSSIAHAHKVRLYMTLNTVLYDSEIRPALALVGKAQENGIDAVIVQDTGMISLLRKTFPSLEIHASTQMTTHNIAQCRILADSGLSQVNLSRELSVQEIKPLAAFLHERGIVPEVFIHGAYCISYSGQCYFSGGLYGLPGNRGQCVQPCRREFCLSQWDKAGQVATIGEDADTAQQAAPGGQQSTGQASKGSFFTPFNLKDNCAFQDVRKLAEACSWGGMSFEGGYDGSNDGSSIAAGGKKPLCSFKIEGRIKSPDYVYAVTSAWREELDKLEKGRPLKRADDRLSLSMNRGFSAGYLEGDISREMFTSGKKDHSWTECGKVEDYRADTKTLIMVCGDSVPEKDDELAIYEKDGSFICNALVRNLTGRTGKRLSIEISMTGKLNGKIRPGQKLLRIKHFLSEQKLSQIKEKLNGGQNRSSDKVIGKAALSVQVRGKKDGFLESLWSIKDEKKHKKDKLSSVEVKSETRLSAAQKRSLDSETIKEKFGKLGDSPFFLGETDCSALDTGLFLPLGELNEMRRKATAQLAKILETSQEDEKENKKGENFLEPSGKRAGYREGIRRIKLLQSPAEFKTGTELQALELPVIFENEDIKKEYMTFLSSHKDLIPYFPAILFEEDFSAALDFLKSLAAEEKNGSLRRTLICENAGLMKAAYDQGFAVIPGFHLNITNSYSISEYKRLFNCPAVIPSPEMTLSQIEELIIPQDTELWLLPEAEAFFMQSRQCLVGRASGCKKKATDRECLRSCSRKVLLKGRQGETVIAEKRPGFYSRLRKG